MTSLTVLIHVFFISPIGTVHLVHRRIGFRSIVRSVSTRVLTFPSKSISVIEQELVIKVDQFRSNMDIGGHRVQGIGLQALRV